MSDAWRILPIGPRIRELPKSELPAGAADQNGAFPFYCSSSDVKRIDLASMSGSAILMGTGGVATVHLAKEEFSYSTDTWAFTVSDPKTQIEFLYRQLAHKLEEVDYKGFSGSGLRHLEKDFVRRLCLPTPSLDEQRAVIRIFDGVDTAIQKTEAIITKLKAVKHGLLHDLLTRGIDANGELRPPQPEAPHLYKQSSLGWIPKEWDVIRIGEDAAIEHGFAFAGDKFTDKQVGPALLVPGNFHREGGLYFTAENTKYYSGDYQRQYVLSSGDVLVVMTDLSPMTLILGRTALLTQSFRVLHNQRVGKYRFKRDDLWDKAYFAEAVSQDAVRYKIIAEATGTTVRHTSPSRILSCHLARPKIQEQRAATQRIAAIDDRKRQEQATLLKLMDAKVGLMDDLLTGRVRVAPLLSAEQQARTRSA